jgi:glycosyltransferase involved in cell wall biosynthesis
MEFYPPVSIIIVNYNGIRYIQRTLQALDILTYPNLEIIVVDNGSSDGSVEYLSKLNNVTLVISPKKAEKNFACNYAVTQAKGEYLLMLDNDLLINTPDFIQSVVHDYSSLQDIGTFGFVFRNEGEELIRNYGIYLGLFFDRPLKAIKEHQILPHHGHEIGYAAGAIIFVKKTVWQQVGGYDDHLQFGEMITISE